MLYQLSHEPELWVKDWAGRRWANWLRALGSHLCGESSLTRAVVAIVANSHRSSSLPVRGPSPLSQPDTFQNVTRSPPLGSYLCATLNYHSALHFSLDMFFIDRSASRRIAITPQWHFMVVEWMAMTKLIIIKPSIWRNSEKPTLNSAKGRTNWYFFLQVTWIQNKSCKMTIPFDIVIFLEVCFEEIILNERYFTRYL